MLSDACHDFNQEVLSLKAKGLDSQIPLDELQVSLTDFNRDLERYSENDYEYEPRVLAKLKALIADTSKDQSHLTRLMEAASMTTIFYDARPESVNPEDFVSKLEQL